MKRMLRGYKWECLDVGGAQTCTIRRRQGKEQNEYVLRSVGGRVLGGIVVFKRRRIAVVKGCTGEAEVVLQLSGDISKSLRGVDLFPIRGGRKMEGPVEEEAVLSFAQRTVSNEVPRMVAHVGADRKSLCVNDVLQPDLVLKCTKMLRRGSFRTTDVLAGACIDPPSASLLALAIDQLVKYSR